MTASNWSFTPTDFVGENLYGVLRTPLRVFLQEKSLTVNARIRVTPIEDGSYRLRDIWFSDQTSDGVRVKLDQETSRNMMTGLTVYIVNGT